jgi:hypothetical protein
MLTRRDFDVESLSYFPLLVEEVNTKKKFQVDCVEQLPEGQEIKVLEINYKEGITECHVNLNNANKRHVFLGINQHLRGLNLQGLKVGSMHLRKSQRHKIDVVKRVLK